jgi:tRNA/tmRNA/rRNA uracil-C5-methylase (TrmA/RlmC/RlmD family)
LIASPAINGHLSRILEELGTLEASEFVEAVTVKESEGGILRTFHYRRPYRFKTAQKGTYHLEGLRLAYGLSSFFQVNHAMIPQLVAEVREAMNPSPEDVLFDCYAGTGLFSLALSRNVSCSVGIESNREAAGHFEKNVRDNHLRNVRIGRGRAEALLQPLFRTFGKKGRCLLLLDPPRDGLTSELIQALKELDFRKICYVSCEVSHLARDLKRLGPNYRLEQVRSLDLFPQTQYLETAAILGKTDSK